MAHPVQKYSAVGCETEIDFVFVGKRDRRYVRDEQLVSWKLQYWLLVVDVD